MLSYLLATVLIGNHLIENRLESLETAPAGEYLYGTAADHSATVAVRKADRTVIGVELRAGQGVCFRGVLDGDAIVNATRIFPPYNPAARWSYREGELLNVSRYTRLDQSFSETERAALQTCIQIFSH